MKGRRNLRVLIKKIEIGKHLPCGQTSPLVLFPKIHFFIISLSCDYYAAPGFTALHVIFQPVLVVSESVWKSIWTMLVRLVIFGAKRWKIPICPATCGDNGEWGPKLVLLFSSPQVWSPHQDSQDDISTTSRRHRQYKGKRGRFWCLTSTTLRYGIVLDASATISK